MKIDLAAEMLQASASMTRADVVELVQHGVPPAAIEIFRLAGIARVSRTTDSNLYEPDQDGAWAVITPVLVDHPATPEAHSPETGALLGKVIDLLAWDPEAPDQWALRVGQAAWLGCVPPQYLDPEPVRVWRSVLNWFRAGCVGLAVLSRDPAVAYSLLMSFPGGIWTEDETHLVDLKRTLLRPWPLPEVSVGPPLPWQVLRAAE